MPVYTTTQDARQNRRIAYERIASLFLHADTYDINITLITLNADGTVSFTVNNALTAAQRAHVGLG